MLASASAAVPSVHTPTSTTAEAQLAVFDLGDVGEFGGQPGDAAQGCAVLQGEFAEAGFGGVGIRVQS